MATPSFVHKRKDPAIFLHRERERGEGGRERESERERERVREKSGLQYTSLNDD